MNQGKLYYSNGGKGPGVARIVSNDGETIVMECKPSLESRTKWRRFEISKRAFESPACGWKERKATRDAA